LYLETLKKILNLIRDLKNVNIHIEFINLGGGIGIPYHEKDIMPEPKDLAHAIKTLIKGTYKLILEPGRSIVGPAGVLVTKVLYQKHTHKKNFLVVDAGMNDLIRPSIYNAYHQILSVVDHRHKEQVTYDIVGPICEEADFLARDRILHRMKQGDLIVVKDAGAYGFSMSSNYNSRLRCPEVMVISDKEYIIRDRDTHEELINKEHIPEVLQ
jgi:diaminopimelate decarboxylase